MLAHLSIRDIVLIDRLDLALMSGMSVLTGETGAGKSILLDAFALALGGRGDGGLVRAGQPQGQVTASFDLPENHAARQIARDNGLDTEGDMILRRIQSADGKTRAFVNDQPVGVAVLRAIGEALVEIHGQHDDRALVDPVEHRAILDAFGGLEPQLAAVAAAARALRDIREELAARRSEVEAARKEEDYLRHAFTELDRLGAREGEEEELAAQRQEMMGWEKIAADLNEAHQAVGGDHSPVSQLAGALRKLERRSAQAPDLVEPSLKALSEAIEATERAGQAIEEALRRTRFDPRELERCEERLFALRGAARKYQVSVNQLPAQAEAFKTAIAALEGGETDLSRLEQAERAAEKAYVMAAEVLSSGRNDAAKTLDQAVQAELPPLKLERARFMTRIEADPMLRGPDGFDRVEFWVETNPGTRPGPMVKVASGGELSRFMLALKVVLADKGSAPTLVFDEIDTGVGGAVADAIGERLARLASKVQVMSVTHAPQVAAKASQHLLISKGGGETGATITRVVALEAEARREELARMLAGATITDEARAAAARLLVDIEKPGVPL